MGDALKAVDLYKLYPSGEDMIRAVDGISIEIKQGEFIAVIGPSGCGKQLCSIS